MPFGQNDKDIQQAVKVHNEARKEVGVDKLIWSSKLQNDATIYAQELAKKDKGLAHSNALGDQGENLYLSYEFKIVNNVTSNVFSKTPLKDASVAWYNEIKDYSYASIKMDSLFPKVGHYTQMIWSTTKEVGIGKARSKSGKVYVVARYYPAGNILGKPPY